MKVRPTNILQIAGLVQNGWIAGLITGFLGRSGRSTQTLLSEASANSCPNWPIRTGTVVGRGPPFVADGSSAALRHSWRVSFASSQSRFISSKYNFALSPESQLNLSLGEHVEHVASATGGKISRATVFAIRHEKEEFRFLEHCQTDTTVACPVAYYLEGTDVMWNSADDAPNVDWESLDSVSVLFLSFHKDSTKETELRMEVNRMSGIELKRLMFVQ